MHVSNKKPLGLAIFVAALGVGQAVSAKAPPKLSAPPASSAPIKSVSPGASAAKPPGSAPLPVTPAPKGSASAAAPVTSAAPAPSGKPAPSAAGSVPAPGPSGLPSSASEAAKAAIARLPVIAGTREQRLEALRERISQRKGSFADRQKAARERTQIRWGSVVFLPPVREELRGHAMRVARLERIRELAEVEGKPQIVARATQALERENARHERRMGALATGAPVPAASGGAK
jgi:hypothetical protein